MTDFANLVLASDTTGLLKAEDALNDVAVAARRTETAVKTSATGTKTALAGVGTAGAAAAGGFSLAGNGARMMGMQLSQVGQQTMASGNFLQALAIQLPDIGLAFGTVGIAAGLLAGIALPVLGRAFGAGKSQAETFADALDLTRTAMGELNGVIGSVATLEGQYKEAIEQGNTALAQRIAHLVDLRIKEAEYMALDLPSQIRSQQEAFDDLARSQREASQALQSAAQAAQSALNGGDTGQFEIALVLLDDARESYEGITTQADLAANRTAQLTDELAIATGTLGEARQSADEMARGLDNASNASSSLGQSIAVLGPGLNNAAAAAGGLADSLWGAANAAANAAQNIYAAMQQQVTLRQASAGTGGVMSGLNSGLGQLGQTITRTAVALNPLRLNFHNVQIAAGGGGGGGGGAAGAVDDLTDSLAATTAELTPAQQAAKDYADTISGYFTDTIGNAVDYMVDGFKGGMKGLFTIFADGIKQMIAFAIKNKITAFLGMGGVATAGGAAAGGVAPVAGGGVMSGIGSALGALGSAFMSGLSGTFSGLMSGGFSGALAGAQAAIAGTTTALGGFAAAAGAIALPLLAVAGIFMALKKKTEVLDAGLRVSIHGLSLTADQFERIKTSRLFGLIKNTRTNFTGAGADVANPLRDAYSDVRTSVMDMAAVLGVGEKAFSKFSASFQLSLLGLSQEQAQAAIAAEFQKISDSLAGLAQITGNLIHDGETATQALTRLSTSLTVVNSAFDTLGFSLFRTSLAGGVAASAIVDLFGGLDQFASATENYFQNFYTLAERTAAAQSQLGAAMTDIGLTRIPATTAAFRAMVDHLMAVEQSARAAQLIGLAPLFQQLLALQEQAATTGGAIGGLTDAEIDRANRLKELLQERAGLDRQILELQGNTAAIRALELAALNPLNRSRQLEIWRLQDLAAATNLAATAAQTLADKMKSIADERYGLETQLLELQGRTADLRNRELAALDPSNRALQRMIWGLQDAKDALDKLDMNDFASLVDYQVAQARSGVIAAPVLITKNNQAEYQRKAEKDSADMAALKSEMAAMRDQNSQLLTQVVVYARRDSNTISNWEINGMPPVRAA